MISEMLRSALSPENVGSSPWYPVANWEEGRTLSNIIHCMEAIMQLDPVGEW